MSGEPSRTSSSSATLAAVLVLLWLSVFLNYIDRSNLSIAAPQIKSEMGISATQLGFLFAAFFWTYSCMQIPVGWLVDRLDVKWVFAAGFLAWSAATAVTGVLHSFVALFAVRIVLGIGESVAYPSYSKIIANHFPLPQRGLANSVVASGLCFGPSFGMLLGGTLMGRFGWRPFFITLGLGSLIWLGPWAICMPRSPRTIEAHSGEGPNLLKIVRRRSWLATALGLFCANYYNYFILTWLPFYLARERGYSMNGVAWVGGSLLLLTAVSALVAGKLSDRWIAAGSAASRVRRGFMIFGGLWSGFFLAASAFAHGNLSIVLLFAAGIGFGAGSANMWAITQTLAGPRAVGRWSGSQNFIGNLSGVAAPALTGLLVDRTGHFFWPLLITGIVAWTGAAAWMFLSGPIEPVNWAEQQAYSASC